MEEYKTLRAPASDEFTEKRSRFIGYAQPVSTQVEAAAFIERIKKQHHDATHNVFAYLLREGQLERYSDDGEPQGTAGIPVLDVLRKQGVTNCAVVVSDEPIGSPLVTEPPIAVLMNKPSLKKFEPTMEKGGLLLYNSSLIDEAPTRDDVTVVAVPCNDIAEQLGNSRTANMVMLGAMIERTGVISIDSAMEALKATFGPKKEHLLPINRQAMEAGAAAARA